MRPVLDQPVQATAGAPDPVPAWHALDGAEVALALSVDPEVGLSAAVVAERRTRHGSNELGAEEQRSVLDLLVSQLRSPLIAILIAACAVTVAIGEHADAAVIAAVLVLNTVIGFAQEHRADRSVAALLQLASPTSSVLREGRTIEVDARALVPGDVVVLASGDRVPADLRLIRATQLRIDESLLTGESEPTEKGTDPTASQALVADRTSSAFMGSIVSSGRGLGIVVAIGAGTELGRIAERIRAEVRPRTPLQQRMHRFANLIALAVGVSTAATLVLGLAVGEPLHDMFLTAVALAVAVVPEGLPVAVTVAMALGVRRMAARNAIVRTLPAVETLGSTDTIGSDKTGTLTQNRMTVQRVWTHDGATVLRGEAAAGVAVDAAPSSLLERTLRTAVLANEAEAAAGGEHRGDPTEIALLVAADDLGLDPGAIRRSCEVVAEVPFESARGYSLVVTDEGGGRLRMKGAPERVVERCTWLATSAGQRPIDRAAVLEVAEAMARSGLRVLAMADVAWRADDAPPTDPGGLTLTGLLGMQDPPRPGVREAIAACAEARVRVVMITGDHAATARSIAADLGLGRQPAEVLTGTELETMSDAELRERVLDVDVYARVSPEHKHRVVAALRSHDQVVAVTGDGVNDGPALKAADIGVAMGRSGTDVAREASDMVLTDDDFVSIVAAVEEGRVVFDNVRKVTYFLLSTGVASIVAILTSIVAGWSLPYTPAALLWLNVVTNGLQDVALAFERAEPDVLRQPPRRRGEGIVTPVLWQRTVLLGVTMAAGSLWLYAWAMGAGLDLAQQRGAALTTLVIAMAVHAGNARSERRSLFAVSPRDNPFLVVAVVLAVVLHVLASHWAPVQNLLSIAPVTAGGWLRIGLVATVVVAVSELHKVVRRRRDRP